MAPTFIIDCPWCKAKVAAALTGESSNSGYDEDAGEPFANRLYVGKCPSCGTLLAGESHQVGFDGHNSFGDIWSDIVRIHPKPAKTFSSHRIPRVVKDSLTEADKSLQVGAYTASCVMLGRALEALCRDILEPTASASSTPPTPKKKMMLGQGIKALKDGKHIDERLFDWSQQLHAFRNVAAHPDDIIISRQDAEDLQIFTYAIIEYIYDLSDRYDEFKARLARGEARKKK